MKRTYISPASHSLRLNLSFPLADSLGVYNQKAGPGFTELSNKKGNDHSMWDAMKDE